MEAGREFDVLIAEKVMGLVRMDPAHPRSLWADPTGESQIVLPNYSSDIAAAWEVVTRLQRAHPVKLTSDITGHWLVSCGPFKASDPNAPLAICMAALKAVGAS